jgi:hypothetical protein
VFALVFLMFFRASDIEIPATRSDMVFFFGACRPVVLEEDRLRAGTRAQRVDEDDDIAKFVL